MPFKEKAQSNLNENSTAITLQVEAGIRTTEFRCIYFLMLLNDDMQRLRFKLFTRVFDFIKKQKTAHDYWNSQCHYCWIQNEIFLWVNPYIWIHVQLFYQDCDWKALQPDWFINHQWQQQQKLSHVNIDHCVVFIMRWSVLRWYCIWNKKSKY